MKWLLKRLNARFLTIVCIVHCTALPLLSLAIAGTTAWHDSPVMRAIEVALICFAVGNSGRLSLNFWRHRKFSSFTWGMLACVTVVLSAIFDANWITHWTMVAGLLALAAFQFHANRVQHCCTAHHDHA